MGVGAGRELIAGFYEAGAAGDHMARRSPGARTLLWYVGTAMAKHDESDAFGTRARRKPQR